MNHKVLVLGKGFVGRTVIEGFCAKEVDVVGWDINGNSINDTQEGLIINSKGVTDIFICVGTPVKNGITDVRQVDSAVRLIEKCVNKNERPIVYLKSTVPMGMTRTVQGVLPLDVVYAPEFLREDTALEDFLHPNKLVFGVYLPGKTPGLRQHVMDLYSFFRTNTIAFVEYEEAELVKLGSNFLLASRVASANYLSEVADMWDADIHNVLRLLKRDPRIGRQYLSPGPGFGGSCFPKDLKMLANAVRSSELPRLIGRENEHHIAYCAQKILTKVLRLPQPIVTFLGLSYKENIGDLRESQALKIIEYMYRHRSEINIRTWDPRVSAETRKGHYDGDPLTAMAGSDLVVIMNCERALMNLKWKEINKTTKIYDPRGCLHGIL